MVVTRTVAGDRCRCRRSLMPLAAAVVAAAFFCVPRYNLVMAAVIVILVAAATDTYGWSGQKMFAVHSQLRLVADRY